MDIYQRFKLLQKMEVDQRIASVLAVQAENEVTKIIQNLIFVAINPMQTRHLIIFML
jgi:hypothetical protein